MDYCIAIFRSRQKQEAIYNYIADGLYAIVEKNITYSCRLHELLHPVTDEEKEQAKEDNKKEAKRIRDKLRNKLRG